MLLTVPITDETLKKWKADFYKCPKNILAQNVCSRGDPFDMCLSRKVVETTQHVYTYKVSIRLFVLHAMQIWHYLHTLLMLMLMLFNLMLFSSGGIRRQTGDESEKFRSLLVVRRLELHTCAVHQTIQFG